MVNRIVAFLAFLVIGVVMLPVIKEFWDELYPTIADLPNISDFNLAFWKIIPLIFLAYLFIAALFILMKSRR